MTPAPHTAPMTQEELKPCPFCGGQASTRLDAKEHYYSHAYIWCGACNYEISEDNDLNLPYNCRPNGVKWGDADLAKTRVAARWNTRAAASPRLAGSREPLRWLVTWPDGATSVVSDLPEDGRASDVVYTPLYTNPAPSESVGWQPIESAPLPSFDKSKWYMEAFACLGAKADHVFGRVSYGYTERGKGRWQDARGYLCQPTHWMPLPAPPTSHASHVLGSDE